MFSGQFSATELGRSPLGQILTNVVGKVTDFTEITAPTELNRKEAIEMACLCRLAHLATHYNIVDLREILANSISDFGYKLENYLYGDEILFGNDHSSCYGLFVTHSEYTIVALRGTRHINDWLFNFLTNANESEIHSGVSYLTDCLWQPLTTFLNNPAHSNKQIIITGHSLGGAVATLIVHRLHQVFPHLKVIGYTFGAPPISRDSLQVGDRFFRLRTPRDFIPYLFKVLGQFEGLLPFTDDLSSYQHSGPEYLIDERYQITKITGLKGWQQLGEITQTLLGDDEISDYLGQGVMSDHQMIRYIELLNFGLVPVELRY